MRKNVLISTTRQWNPGDEFIMLGCLNILKEIYGDNINPIIFNRNPDIRVGGRYHNKTKYKKILEEKQLYKTSLILVNMIIHIKMIWIPIT